MQLVSTARRGPGWAERPWPASTRSSSRRLGVEGENWEESQLGVAQADVVARVYRHITELGGLPIDLSAKEALEKLPGSGAYEVGPSTVMPFDDSCVSLPTAGTKPAPIKHLYGHGGDHFSKTLLPRISSNLTLLKKLLYDRA